MTSRTDGVDVANGVAGFGVDGTSVAKTGFFSGDFIKNIIEQLVPTHSKLGGPTPGIQVNFDNLKESPPYTKPKSWFGKLMGAALIEYRNLGTYTHLRAKIV